MMWLATIFVAAFLFSVSHADKCGNEDCSGRYCCKALLGLFKDCRSSGGDGCDYVPPDVVDIAVYVGSGVGGLVAFFVIVTIVIVCYKTRNRPSPQPVAVPMATTTYHAQAAYQQQNPQINVITQQTQSSNVNQVLPVAPQYPNFGGQVYENHVPPAPPYIASQHGMKM